MRRVTLVLALALASTLPACGGGGGGDAPAAATIPGSLIALAVQGQATPIGAPTTGVFAPIDTVNPIMDVAVNGWVAFVASVNTGMATVPVLYVAEPDGDLHEVYTFGNLEPGGSGGAISGFNCVWMCADGTVFVHATMVVPAPATGVLAAQVSGGVVINKSKVVYQTDVLPGSASPLVGIDYAPARLDATCTFWFQGVLLDGTASIYSVEEDGSGIVQHVSSGQVLPGALTVAGIDTFNVDLDGTYLGFVVDVGAGVQSLFQRNIGTGTYTPLSNVGDAMPDTIGTVLDPWLDGNPILVYPTGQVLWIAVGSVAGTDHAVLIHDGDPLGAIQLARSGDFAVGSRNGGSLTTIGMIRQRVEANVTFPQIVCGVTGDIDGIIVSTYAVGGNGLNRYMYNGRLFVDGRRFNGALAGLNTGKYRAGSRGTALAFRDTLNDGTTGLFWVFPSAGPFPAALQGGAALGGTDTFGSFASTAHTCEVLYLLFTANLTTSGSGLFRQG